ncbi:hypothetical protein [Nesterenkonia sp. NBAIMH1]|uniref:hypothetical protein n=1 Tax=Nesterenkonia sp. NBAIMH1 TaxID=2600320 RepID=UPI0011B3BEA3|nr:hypothetical protein [Nesterenkonia sp. NBAIMH1]
MRSLPPRAEELIAAELAGETTDAERAELEALAVEDHSVRRAWDELAPVAARLERSVGAWDEADPPARLADTVSPAAPAEDPSPSAVDEASPADGARGRRRRLAAWFALAAAGSFLAGAGLTAVLDQTMDRPPDGPPGTYGMVEEVTFDEATPQAEIDASIIAHTWGTETVLEIDGLAPERTFTVTLVDEDGVEHPSGTFFGSELLIECRMNAAVMRQDVSHVEIHADDGSTVAAADLPPATDPES